MSSKLETSLSKDDVRAAVFNRLQIDGSLRNLRLTSRILKTFVDSGEREAFHSLFVHAPLRKRRQIRDLEHIAPSCQHLTVKVAFPEPEDEQLSSANSSKRRNPLHPLNIPFVKTMWTLRQKANFERRASTIHTPSTLALVPAPLRPSARVHETDPDLLALDLGLWTYLLSRFGASLTTLTLRVNSSAAWPGRTAVEEILVTLRLALERNGANLPNLCVLDLNPIHAMGILHLRWDPFGAWRSCSSGQLWRNITTLSIRLLNPMPSLTDRQEAMFRRFLHSYLLSFAPSLQVLRFTWVGHAGPSPLTLTSQTMFLPMLKEVRLGNTLSSTGDTTTSNSSCVPTCTTLEVLRSASSHALVINEEGLVDINPDIGNDATSVYSRSVGGRSPTRVNRASGEIPIMLHPDLRRQTPPRHSRDSGHLLAAKTYVPARAWWRKSRIPTS